MVRVRCLCLSLVIVLGASASADASYITIDPNNFPIGTDLSEMFDGVTLHRRQAVRRAPASPDEVCCGFYNDIEPVLVTPSYHNRDILSIGYSTFEAFFAEFCIDAPTCLDEYYALELLFDRPTDFVHFVTIGFDIGGLLAYDVAGNLVVDSRGPNDYSWTYDPNSHDGDGTTTISRNTPDIKRIIFGGWNSTVSTTQITYHKVPAPSTLLLSVFGVLVFLRQSTRRPCH